MHQLLRGVNACRKRLKILPRLSQRNARRHQPGLDRLRMGTDSVVGEERMAQPVAAISPVKPPALEPCLVPDTHLSLAYAPLACRLLPLDALQVAARLLGVIHAPFVLLVSDPKVPRTLHLPLELETLLFEREPLLGEIRLSPHLPRELGLLVIVRVVVMVVLRAHPSMDLHTNRGHASPSYPALAAASNASGLT